MPTLGFPVRAPGEVGKSPLDIKCFCFIGRKLTQSHFALVQPNLQCLTLRAMSLSVQFHEQCLVLASLHSDELVSKQHFLKELEPITVIPFN